MTSGSNNSHLEANWIEVLMALEAGVESVTIYIDQKDMEESWKARMPYQVSRE